MMLAGLQYRLWIADGGISHTHRLQNDIRAETGAIERLRARNTALEAEIEDLKSGLAAIESRARQSLGMVRKGETFYLVVQSR
jgi:cell division protein FtsB